MTVRNITELKKYLQRGVKLVVLDHQKPEFIGHTRKVTKVQTNAVYTVIPDCPAHPYSKCNGGWGSRMDYAKSDHYKFGETVKWYSLPVGSDNNTLIMEFKVLH